MRTSSDATAALRTTDLLVLVILGDGPRHGYAIAQAVDERSGGQVRVRPGELYRVLYRLDRAGWLEELPESARPAGDERRTYYRITTLGRRVAREQASMLSRAVAPLLRQQAKGTK